MPNLREHKMGSGGLEPEDFNVVVDTVQILADRAGAARLKFSYSTPGLTAGIEVYRPSMGDVILSGYLGTINVFNGANPKLNLYFEGADPDTQNVYTLAASATQWRAAPLNGQPILTWKGAFGTSVPTFDTERTLMLNLTNGSGGNPNSTAGTGEFFLAIARAL